MFDILSFFAFWQFSVSKVKQFLSLHYLNIYGAYKLFGIILLLLYGRIFKHISFYLTETPTSSPIVAFTAVLTHPVSLGPLQAIEFDKVITNIGNAYETRDGQFSAPVSGVYLISATVYAPGRHSVFIEIVKNGQQLAAMYGSNNDDHPGQIIVVVLSKTDRVWVRHFRDNNIANIFSDADRHYCSFSGVLLAVL